MTDKEIEESLKRAELAESVTLPAEDFKNMCREIMSAREKLKDGVKVIDPPFAEE